MAGKQAQPDAPVVRFGDDKLTAELVLPPRASQEVLTLEALRAVLEAEQVSWDEPVREAVEQLLAQPRPPDRAVSAVVARGVEPTPGDDGHIDWTIDVRRQQDDAQAQSHYERSAFIFVEPGQILGHVIAPTPGAEGRDVTGAPIAPRPGEPAELQHDETICRHGDGRIEATIHGRLVRQNNHVHIARLLEVDSVDFSTGNIDFKGSITIRNGVKDKFLVKATEGIEVHGLVEAARFECGGDLVIHGGFAGREAGFAQVQGSLHARYLDGVQAEVRYDLVLDREAINCDLLVHGDVQMAEGTLIGGQLVVAGQLHVGNIGSPGGVATQITVGSVPRLQSMFTRLAELRNEYLRQIEAVGRQLDTIRGMSRREQALEINRRRLAKLEQLLPALRSQFQRAEQARVGLKRKIDELSIVDVHIMRCLYEGVLFHHGRHSYRMHTELIGPLRIVTDSEGVLAYNTGHGGGPMTHVAELVSARRTAA